MPWYRRYRTKYRTSRTIDPQPRIVVPFVPWAHRDQKNVEQHGAKEARGHGFLGVPTYPHHDTCTHFKDGVHTCICQFESSVRVDTGLVAHRWLVSTNGRERARKSYRKTDGAKKKREYRAKLRKLNN